MNDRLLRVLWTLMALVAVGLGAATAYLFRETRRLSAVAQPPYRIAYVSWQDDDVGLQTCNLQGQDVRRLTSAEGMDAFVAAEPLHAGMSVPRVAFLRAHPEPQVGASESSVGMEGAVYVMSADGGPPVQVSGTLQRIWDVPPCWLAGGKQLVFAALEDLNGDGKWLADESGLYICDADKAEPRRFAAGSGTVTRLACSPIDPLVIVTWVESDRTSSALLSTEGGKPLLEGDAPVACWSPDGAQIAAYLLDDRRIHILRTDASELYDLEPPPGEIVDLLWLPMWPAQGQNQTGQLLAVASSQHGIGAGQMYLRSVEPRAESWQRLSNQDDYIIHMAPSPDGRYVAYTLYTGSSGQRNGPPQADLYLLDLSSGQDLRLTTDKGFEGLAAWIPRPQE